MRRLACLLIAFAATACSTVPINAPSLETRPGELLDPRLPVEDPNAVPRAVSPSVRTELDGLLAFRETNADMLWDNVLGTHFLWHGPLDRLGGWQE